MSENALAWPPLPYAAWRATALTLQLWTQIVGKIRLALTPWVNHSWQVPLYVTARGLTTSPIPFKTEIFDVEFDFNSHRLVVHGSGGAEKTIPLEPQAVAVFYGRLMDALRQIGISVRIDEHPSEMLNPVRFSEDYTHASYDATATHTFWQVLVQVDRIFKRFRSGFLGKVSPVHFFWGSFDLAVTRFSGRRAPPHPGGVPGLPDGVAREAYSHEVSSAGFWPGSDLLPQPVFYSYAYPEPAGFRNQQVPPDAYFDARLGEFILPYEAVRASADPEAALLEFLTATYTAAADPGHWERQALECPLGVPGRVRSI